MVEIGGNPILWHIMKIYSHYGFNDFIICLGYKGYAIKEYFANYVLHQLDVTIELANNTVAFFRAEDIPPWRVSLIDTGSETMTGGRLKRVRYLLSENEPFMMTYGDGLSDVNLKTLRDFHYSHGLDATVTTVRPPGRFGATVIEGERVKRFMEKPLGDDGYINGGFFVLNPCVIDRIEGDDMPWEAEPLMSLAADGQLAAFIHNGFWQPMDTPRDRTYLEKLWADEVAPWKIWG